MLNPMMIDSSLAMLPVAAAGIAFLYYILGGGFFGAVVLFFVLKMFGNVSSG